MRQENLQMPKVISTDSYQLNNRSGGSDSKLIPVNIQFSQSLDTLTIHHHRLRIEYLQPQDRQSLRSGATQQQRPILLNLDALTTGILKGELQLLGTVKRFPLPQALLAYIKEHQLPIDKLTQLAERLQGYPIGQIKVRNDVALFPPALRIKLSPGQFVAGDYNATLVANREGSKALQLALSPIVNKAAVLLHPLPTQATSAVTGQPETSQTVFAPQSKTQELSDHPARQHHFYNQLEEKLGKHLLTAEQREAILRSASNGVTNARQHGAYFASGINVSGKNVSGMNGTGMNVADSGTQKASPAQVPIFSGADKTQRLTPMIYAAPIEQASLPSKLPLIPRRFIGQVNKTQLPGNSLLFKRVAKIEVNWPTPGQSIESDLSKTRLAKTPEAQRLAGASMQRRDLHANGAELAEQTKPRHRGLDLALNLLNRGADANKTQPQSSINKQSLLSLVKQLHPLLLPRPLSELAQPSVMQQELIDANLAANLVPADGIRLSLNSHSSTIGILFQLLLGREHSQKLSSESKQQLSALQQRFALGANLLALLEKADTLSIMAKLVSGLSLYQQASSDNAQGTDWYFTLPYMLDNRQESFEGHFQQEVQAENKNKLWRLRLKFNLSAGAVLINAEVREKQLKLNFTASSDKLLALIERKLDPLSDKINAIGLIADTITAHQDKVPASLLPGDNHLGSIAVRV